MWLMKLSSFEIKRVIIFILFFLLILKKSLCNKLVAPTFLYLNINEIVNLCLKIIKLLQNIHTKKRKKEMSHYDPSI